MPYSNEAKNYMLDQLGTQVLFGSLHTGAPASTGANEIPLLTGTPNYKRMGLTWNPASTGSKTLSDTPIFDVPPATTVAYVGLWLKAAAGTVGDVYYGYIDVTDEIFAAQGTYQITSGTVDLNATTSA